MIGCARCTAMANAVIMPGLTPNESRMLAFFVALGSAEGISLQEISDIMHISRQAAISATKRLASKAMGELIKVTRHFRSANDYSVQDDARLRAALPWKAAVEPAAADSEAQGNAPDAQPARTSSGFVWPWNQPDFETTGDESAGIEKRPDETDTGFIVKKPALLDPADSQKTMTPGDAADSQKNMTDSMYSLREERESISDSESVPPREEPPPPPDATRRAPSDFIAKPDFGPSDRRFIAFLSSIPLGWVLNASGTGYVPPPPAPKAPPKLHVVGGTAENIRGMEAMGTPDRDTGKAVYGGCFIDDVAREALTRAGLDPANPPQSTRARLRQWIDDGIEPESIYLGIDWKMQQERDGRVMGLGYFDATVRIQHAIAQRKGHAGG